MLPARDYAGLELSSGTIILDAGSADHVAKDHVGERMKGGRILVQGEAGDYLGQEMSGGGIVAGLPGLCLPKHARRLWRGSGRFRQIPGSGQLWRQDRSAWEAAARGQDG